MVAGRVSRTTQWLMGAGLAALCPFVHAAPAYPHGGGHSVRAEAFHGRGAPGPVWVAHAPRRERRAFAQAAEGERGNRVAGRRLYRYAGTVTPVSAETRQVPQPPEDASLIRAGSIRADVTRYNEEREAAPQRVPRPPGYAPHSSPLPFFHNWP
jgi:hypothetical protein